MYFFNTGRQATILDKYNNNSDVVLVEGDCRELLVDLPSESVDLVITSPPYNVGKRYEKSMSLEKYLHNQEPVVAELIRVLASTGSICWQVGNYVHKGEVFPLDIFFYDLFNNTSDSF